MPMDLVAATNGRNKAAIALVKLLIKLQLVDPHTSLGPILISESLPINHLAKAGLFEEPDAIRIIATKLNIPHIIFDYAKESASLAILDDLKLAPVSLSRWKESHAIPIEFRGNSLLVAFANPLDHETKAALEFDLNLPVEIAIAAEDFILALINKKIGKSAVFDLESLAQEAGSEPSEEATAQESNITSGDLNAAPIVRIVNKILFEAVARGASDIHISPEKNALVIKVRVDGLLHQIFSIPERLKNAVTSRLKLLCGMDIAERRKPQDGRLRIKTGLGIKDLRISVIPTVHGENIVARVLSSELSRITFESLGMSNDQETLYRNALQRSSQLILVTGPTGSGKTSTLYASILALRDGTSNIITIEDPIEYRFQGVNQIQVNAKIGVTFAESLRSVLRQDPDIIMLGEIRDEETAAIAMQVAQTGHLVLSTIHANSAPAVITRLLDLKVPPYVIASSLGMVVAQRLVRKLCQKCSVPLSAEKIKKYEELHLDLTGFREAVGCDECGKNGYVGRAGVFSLLSMSDALRQAIRDGLGESELESRAKSTSYQSLEQAALELLATGATSIEEVERNVGPILGSPPLVTPTSTTLSKRKILLVEDEENTRTVLSLLLKSEMFDVAEAKNGYEGLEKVYEFQPELILCDLMMPRMTGLELVQKLRSDRRTRSIPILMLTAADTEENEVQSIHSGADDFVSKTAGSKIVLARVYRLLERQGEKQT